MVESCAPAGFVQINAGKIIKKSTDRIIAQQLSEFS